MAEFQVILKLANVPSRSMCTCMLDDRELLIRHTRAGVFALDNICTHAHARRCEGHLRATRLAYPLHGASFDVRDGRVLAAPAEVALPTYALRVVADAIEVAL
jgi:nitrite reductase/ring-hydroxylating ferredoxin subunit